MKLSNASGRVERLGRVQLSYNIWWDAEISLTLLQAPPCQKPPMVPRLGLNVALGSSAPPSSEKAALASLAFPSDDEAALGRPSLDIVAAGP